MGDDYAMPQRRKNKNDKRSKARFNRFKQGGSQRSANISLREKHKSR